RPGLGRNSYIFAWKNRGADDLGTDALRQRPPAPGDLDVPLPALGLRVPLQPFFKNPVNVRLAHLAVTGQLAVDSRYYRDCLRHGFSPVDIALPAVHFIEALGCPCASRRSK